VTDPMQTVAQQGGEPIPGQTTPTTEADARAYVEEAAQQTNAGLSWADVESDIEAVGDYLTDGTRRLLASTGLDGIAIEFSVGADVGVTIGGEVTTGISVFWPLHSDYDPNDDPHAGPDVRHPIDDAPHFYLFTSEGITFGVDLGGSAGFGAQFVLAWHWGGAEKITRKSWGGSVVSFDIDGALALGVGAEISFTAYFSSVTSTGSGPTGTVTWSEPDAGWHGTGIAASPKSGAELELTTGITVTNALSKVIDFGRPDVREAMQNPVDIPEQGDMHYHTPDAGPGFVHALIEAMTEW